MERKLTEGLPPEPSDERTQVLELPPRTDRTERLTALPHALAAYAGTHFYYRLAATYR